MTEIQYKDTDNCIDIYFEEMKNTLIHNFIGSHTNCFMSLLEQFSVLDNLRHITLHYIWICQILRSNNFHSDNSKFIFARRLIRKYIQQLEQDDGKNN